MEGKNSFIGYCDWIHTFELLSDDEAGKLIKHLLRYVNGKDPQLEDRLLQVTWEPIKQVLKRDLSKYVDYIEKQRKNGERGGRPKNTQKTQPFYEKTKKADSDSVSDSVSDSDSDSVSEMNNIPDFSFKKSLIDLGLKDNLATEFMMIRKNKYATNTKTAFSKLKIQIEKSGIEINELFENFVIPKDWKYFEADWIKQKPNQPEPIYKRETLIYEPN